MRDKDTLYSRVEAFRRRMQVGEGSVDVFALCEQIPGLELRMITLKTPGLNGVFMRGEHTDLILLNAARTHAEQRFDLSHELMHWWLHRDTAFHGREAEKEWQANEGAAELLVPWRELAERVYACRAALGTAQNLARFTRTQAERCGVTEAVIRYRYESLRAELALARGGTQPLRLVRPGGWGVSLNALEAEETGDRTLCAISRR